MPIEVPRDRNGSFEPQLVKKHQTHFDGFDGLDLASDQRGDRGVKAWQERPLEAVYPIVYLDALVMKVRDQGTVTNKSAYLAIGVDMAGNKEVLGLWLEDTEGAKFWLKILTEIKNRGVADILILCCDGLKGFPEAIEAVFPTTTPQITRNTGHLPSAWPHGFAAWLGDEWFATPFSSGTLTSRRHAGLPGAPALTPDLTPRDSSSLLQPNRRVVIGCV